MAIGRGDVAAALCNFGLNCEQTKIFCDAFLAEWDCNIHSSDAFVDGKAKRAMKIISENETNPMHTRAHALVLRGMMSHEFEECPSPATAAYFRRALRYSRKIEAGEMRSIDFVLQGVSLQLDVKERVELNLDVAKRLLSFYEGPGACVGMTLLERISHFDRSFLAFQTTWLSEGHNATTAAKRPRKLVFPACTNASNAAWLFTAASSARPPDGLAVDIGSTVRSLGDLGLATSLFCLV